MTTKLVLWDFGGVLTNSPLENFYNYERRNNFPIGSIIKINSHNKFHNAWALLEKNLINKAEFAKLFLQEARELNLNYEFNIEEILKCLDVKLNNSMVDLFFQVKKKIDCACLTNNIASSIHYEAGKAFDNFKKNFSHIFESSKLGLRKPEKEIYEYVIDNLNINPENILFIDDLGINLKPAKLIGFKTYKMINLKKTKMFLNNIINAK